MEKFIFDLDGTLMNANFELEDDLLCGLFSSKEEFERFSSLKLDIIEEYELLFPKYDKELFRRYINYRAGVNVGSDFIDEWLRFGSCFDDKIIDGVVDTLEYLKMKDKRLIVLSNWFSSVQIERLRKNNLLDYFDDVYGGDYSLKPNRKAFIRAFGSTSANRCVMVGDNFSKDYLGAIDAGCNALYFNPKGENKSKQMIKRIDEIKERY